MSYQYSRFLFLVSRDKEVDSAELSAAAELHPDDGAIQSNLACYEAQLGNVGRAKAHLTRATKADGKFSMITLDDPDLEPFWGSLAKD